jgi:hypothetical protein
LARYASKNEENIFSVTYDTQKGFRYLLEQLPIVVKFVVAQIADNNKSLSYTFFSDTSMTSIKSLSFV